jgi:hypothetical protein
MRRSFACFVMALLFALCLPAGRACAHANGHESRTVADCERLPGSQAAGERGQCLRCVQRPRPHHYHPDMVRGDRCHPDNGLPQ